MAGNGLLASGRICVGSDFSSEVDHEEVDCRRMRLGLLTLGLALNGVLLGQNAANKRGLL
jgi:hypothetical protein